ncbi:hypothetical protein GF357_03420 [Candidatus Dojkabacteria bacterium]|nr:hypothetical protein [Candidatus Dojkabacteria bacterium]
MALTTKQNEVLNAIRRHFSCHTGSPSLSQIGAMVNIESRSGVHYHIQELEKLGILYKTSDGIKLKDEIHFTTIPVLGKANAGQPLILAEEEEIGEIQLDSRVIHNKGNLFALEISGDSMNRHSITNQYTKKEISLCDGNYVIIEKNSDYKDGDVVLAIINECATIKIFLTTEDSVVLMPNSTNSIHKPIFIHEGEDLFINGKCVLALNTPDIR